jgi:hypothetical protein
LSGRVPGLLLRGISGLLLGRVSGLLLLIARILARLLWRGRFFLLAASPNQANAEKKCRGRTKPEFSHDKSVSSATSLMRRVSQRQIR